MDGVVRRRPGFCCTESSMLYRAAFLAGSVAVAALAAASANAAVLISTQDRPAATAAPTASPARAATAPVAAIAVPDSAIKGQAARLTLAPLPRAEPAFRQAFLPQDADPP